MPLKKLKEINFSGNQIHTIEDGTFQENLKLESIDLHNNSIQYLPENTFRGLNIWLSSRK